LIYPSQNFYPKSGANCQLFATFAAFWGIRAEKVLIIISEVSI